MEKMESGQQQAEVDADEKLNQYVENCVEDVANLESQMSCMKELIPVVQDARLIIQYYFKGSRLSETLKFLTRQPTSAIKQFLNESPLKKLRGVECKCGVESRNLDIFNNEQYYMQMAHAIYEEKVLVVYGPGGCGKSWLLRSFAHSVKRCRDLVVLQLSEHMDVKAAKMGKWLLLEDVDCSPVELLHQLGAMIENRQLLVDNLNGKFELHSNFRLIFTSRSLLKMRRRLESNAVDALTEAKLKDCFLDLDDCFLASIQSKAVRSSVRSELAEKFGQNIMKYEKTRRPLVQLKSDGINIGRVYLKKHTEHMKCKIFRKRNGKMSYVKWNGPFGLPSRNANPTTRLFAIFWIICKNWSRGALAKAVELGKWLLIDEINMASPELLNALHFLLDCRAGDQVLLDPSQKEMITVHENFRLIACMNPATDVGKRELNPGLRSRFTEVFVDELDSLEDLRMLTKAYLDRNKHWSITVNVIESLVKFFVQIKSVSSGLSSGFQSASPCYTAICGYQLVRGSAEVNVDSSYVLTDTVKRNLEDLCRVVSSRKYPVLLQGETSVGKTSLISYLANCTGNVCMRINNHQNTDIQDYVGSYVNNASGQLVFVEGPLVKAMRNGHWIILDELNLADSDVLESLNRIFATQNPPGLYGGRKSLSRAFRNRFVQMNFGELPYNEIETILQMRCGLPLSYASKMVAVMRELQANRSSCSMFAGREGYITLRDLFRWGDRFKNVSAQQNDYIQYLAEQDVEEFKHICWTKSIVRSAVLLGQALQFNEPTLLVGDTGCAKTTLCQMFAKANSRSMNTINCHMSTEAADFVGRLVPAPLECQERMSMFFYWLDGPLVKSMKKGEYFLIDEISLAEDAVIERLNSVLEPERTLTVYERIGCAQPRTVRSAPGFNVLATMNPGGDYGKRELSRALRNRFTEIWCKTTSLHACEEQEDMVELLSQNLPVEDDLLRNALAKCAKGAAVSVEERKKFGDDVFEHLLKSLESQLGRVNRSKLLNAHITNHEDHLQIGCFTVAKGSKQCSTETTVIDAFGMRSYDFFRLARALSVQRPILIQGSPGVGKSTLVMEFAALTGHRIIRINLSEQTDLCDLFGSEFPIMNDKSRQMFTWLDGPLLAAVKKGHWVLLDEMNLASQTVLEGLNACFDHRGEITIPELGKTFSVGRTATRFFACQNPYNQGGNRKALPRSFVSRFTLIHLNNLTETDQLEIMRHKFTNIEGRVLKNMVTFNSKLNVMVRQQGFESFASGNAEFNLRDLIRWGKLIVNISNQFFIRLLKRKNDIFQSITGLPYDKLFYTVYAVRMRDYEERSKLFVETTKTNFQKETLDTFVITNNKLYFGDAVLDRREAYVYLGNVACDAVMPPMSLASYYKYLMQCIQGNMLAILVGKSMVGKTMLVKTLSLLCRQKLTILNLTPETDASELLGTYEQEHFMRRMKAACENLALETYTYGCFYAFENLLSLLLELDDVQKLNLNHCKAMLEKLQTIGNVFIAMASLKAKFNDSVNDLQRVFCRCTSESDNVRFVWVESPLLVALREGHWLLVENVNLCKYAKNDGWHNLHESESGRLVKLFSMNNNVFTDTKDNLMNNHGWYDEKSVMYINFQSFISNGKIGDCELISYSIPVNILSAFPKAFALGRDLHFIRQIFAEVKQNELDSSVMQIVLRHYCCTSTTGDSAYRLAYLKKLFKECNAWLSGAKLHNLQILMQKIPRIMSNSIERHSALEIMHIMHFGATDLRWYFMRWFERLCESNVVFEDISCILNKYFDFNLTTFNDSIFFVNFYRILFIIEYFWIYDVYLCKVDSTILNELEKEFENDSLWMTASRSLLLLAVLCEKLKDMDIVQMKSSSLLLWHLCFDLRLTLSEVMNNTGLLYGLKGLSSWKKLNPIRKDHAFILNFFDLLFNSLQLSRCLYKAESALAICELKRQMVCMKLLAKLKVVNSEKLMANIEIFHNNAHLPYDKLNPVDIKQLLTLAEVELENVGNNFQKLFMLICFVESAEEFYGKFHACCSVGCKNHPQISLDDFPIDTVYDWLSFASTLIGEFRCSSPFRLAVGYKEELKNYLNDMLQLENSKQFKSLLNIGNIRSMRSKANEAMSFLWNCGSSLEMMPKLAAIVLHQTVLTLSMKFLNAHFGLMWQKVDSPPYKTAMKTIKRTVTSYSDDTALCPFGLYCICLSAGEAMFTIYSLVVLYSKDPLKIACSKRDAIDLQIAYVKKELKVFDRRFHMYWGSDLSGETSVHPRVDSLRKLSTELHKERQPFEQYCDFPKEREGILQKLRMIFENVLEKRNLIAKIFFDLKKISIKHGKMIGKQDTVRELLDSLCLYKAMMETTMRRLRDFLDLAPDLVLHMQTSIQIANMCSWVKSSLPFPSKNALVIWENANADKFDPAQYKEKPMPNDENLCNLVNFVFSRFFIDNPVRLERRAKAVRVLMRAWRDERSGFQTHPDVSWFKVDRVGVEVESSSSSSDGHEAEEKRMVYLFEPWRNADDADDHLLKKKKCIVDAMRAVVLRHGGDDISGDGLMWDRLRGCLGEVESDCFQLENILLMIDHYYKKDDDDDCRQRGERFFNAIYGEITYEEAVMVHDATDSFKTAIHNLTLKHPENVVLEDILKSVENLQNCPYNSTVATVQFAIGEILKCDAVVPLQEGGLVACAVGYTLSEEATCCGGQKDCLCQSVESLITTPLCSKISCMEIEATENASNSVDKILPQNWFSLDEFQDAGIQSDQLDDCRNFCNNINSIGDYYSKHWKTICDSLCTNVTKLNDFLLQLKTPFQEELADKTNCPSSTAVSEEKLFKFALQQRQQTAWKLVKILKRQGFSTRLHTDPAVIVKTLKEVPSALPSKKFDSEAIYSKTQTLIDQFWICFSHMLSCFAMQETTTNDQQLNISLFKALKGLTSGMVDKLICRVGTLAGRVIVLQRWQRYKRMLELIQEGRVCGLVDDDDNGGATLAKVKKLLQETATLVPFLENLCDVSSSTVRLWSACAEWEKARLDAPELLRFQELNVSKPTAPEIACAERSFQSAARLDQLNVSIMESIQFMKKVKKSCPPIGGIPILACEDFDKLNDLLLHLFGTVSDEIGEILQKARCQFDGTVSFHGRHLDRAWQALQRRRETFNSICSTSADLEKVSCTEFVDVDSLIKELLAVKFPFQTGEKSSVDAGLLHKDVADLDRLCSRYSSWLTKAGKVICCAFFDDQKLKRQARSCALIYTKLVDLISSLYENCLENTLIMCDMYVIFCQLCAVLYEKGFAVPPSNAEPQEGEVKNQQFEDAGMGIGEGARDVSEQIEFEHQVEGLAGEEDRASDTQASMEDVECPIEMEDNFDGNLENLPNSNKNDEDDDTDEDENDGDQDLKIDMEMDNVSDEEAERQFDPDPLEEDNKTRPENFDSTMEGANKVDDNQLVAKEEQEGEFEGGVAYSGDQNIDNKCEEDDEQIYEVPELNANASDNDEQGEKEQGKEEEDEATRQDSTDADDDDEQLKSDDDLTEQDDQREEEDSDGGEENVEENSVVMEEKLFTQSGAQQSQFGSGAQVGADDEQQLNVEMDTGCMETDPQSRTADVQQRNSAVSSLPDRSEMGSSVPNRSGRHNLPTADVQTFAEPFLKRRKIEPAECEQRSVGDLSKNTLTNPAVALENSSSAVERSESTDADEGHEQANAFAHAADLDDDAMQIDRIMTDGNAIIPQISAEIVHDDKINDPMDQEEQNLDAEHNPTDEQQNNAASSFHTDRTFFHCQTDDNISDVKDAILPVDVDSFATTDSWNGSVDQWKALVQESRLQAVELCESLRCLLEPTVASRLQGDYRTGKRLNLRKIIPYIASGFRKDKIWLRRTRKTKRDYQVVLAIDNSQSMELNNVKTMALQSLAMLNEAFYTLEIGHVGVCKFGTEPILLQPLTKTFDVHYGAKIIEQLNCNEQRTDIFKLLQCAASLFTPQPASSDRTDSGMPTKLMIILSDGRNVYSVGEQALKDAVRSVFSAGIFVIYIIVDNSSNANSVSNHRMVIVKPNGEVEFVSYIDRFCFPFHITLNRCDDLPKVISEALKQWIELVSEC
ncbi:putative midasin [Trichinella spiralis]|uniref:putative midasin n=1 Tax=Trichinella spiralis TaxID=6334 RepID=UPI0001F0EB2D|nr:putative midasin [Trichinella spiralis]